MARRMEKRSARLLALLLALIMLGSVFAYMSRGGGTTEKREVFLRLDDFREYVNITPAGAYYLQYVNLSYLSTLPRDDPLRKYCEDQLKNMLVSAVFSRTVLEVPKGFSRIFSASYAGIAIPLYFVDANMSKIYFSKDREERYGEFTIQVRNNGIALIDQISPFVVGYTPLVAKVADIVNDPERSVGNYTYTYLSRINGTFAYAYFMYGDVVKDAVKAENESVADFFFEGYRYNLTSGNYEKVWAMHFIGNYFFAKMNESERNFEFYTVENFDDGLGIAVMGDKNFSKVLQAKPNILSWKIIVNSTQ